MSPQDTLRHDTLTLRDLVEARDAESASITYSTDPSTVLTYTRELGAVLVAGDRTLAITEEWIDSHGLVPVPCDHSALEDER